MTGWWITPCRGSRGGGTVEYGGGRVPEQEQQLEQAQEQLADLEKQEQAIKVELAENQEKKDPVTSVQRAELANLADTYRFHAELLDEQRGQLQGLKEHQAGLQQQLEALQASITEWREFIAQEKERVQQQQPPVGKTRRPFGGPGY